MKKPEHFRVNGCDHEAIPYHYRECGLDNIFLLSGFTREEYDGEEYVSIHDVDGLRKVIALNLVTHQKNLSPKEIRFLRSEMGLTQAELAAKLRVEDQTIARWEKGKVRLPGPADLALRVTYLATPAAQPKGREILRDWMDVVSDLIGEDQISNARLEFEHENEAWTEHEQVQRYATC